MSDDNEEELERFQQDLLERPAIAAHFESSGIGIERLSNVNDQSQTLTLNAGLDAQLAQLEEANSAGLVTDQELADAKARILTAVRRLRSG